MAWKHFLNDVIRPYWTYRYEITVLQDILLEASGNIIPSFVRLEIQNKTHEAHQGITKYHERDKNSLWRPELSKEIQGLPLIPTQLPDRPWQIIATELFELKGAEYLIVIDYFSRCVEMAALTRTAKSSEVIRALESIFAIHGTLEQVQSDNGPQFDSAEFTRFSKEWGFKHNTCSPKFPQSNGEVNRGF